MPEAISPAALAARLRDLYVGRKTGRLVFGEEPRRTALLWKGRVVFASSTAKDEHLGELLVSRGRLSAEDLARASEKLVAEKKRLGETLVSLALLDRDGLEEAVAEHVREIFVRAVDQPEIVVRFEELDPERPLEEDVSSKIATGDLILEAVNRIPDEQLESALGDLGRRLLLSNDPLLRFQRISLGPVDGYVLSRVDGTLSGSELLQMIPMVPEEVKRSLLRLLSAGIVEYEEGGEAPASSAAPEAPASTAAPEAPASTARPEAPASSAAPRAPAPTPPPARAPDPPRSAPATPSPPPPQARPAVPPPSPASPVAAASSNGSNGAPRKIGIAAQRRVIEEAHAALSSQNHFEVLGLTRQVSDAEVKKAYFRLARDFHPDRFADPRLADLRPKAEAIFMRLGEANEILRDPRRRGQYESDLAARAPRVPRPSAPPPGTTEDTPAAENPAMLAQQAEDAVKQARKLFKKEQYWDVIQLVEPQLDYARGAALKQGRLLLAQCYLQNPNWVRRGEELLLAVIEADPNHGHAHFLLGKFYADKGLKSRAASLLQRCVELDSENGDAVKLLQAVRPEAPEAEAKSKGGGLLKKLFG